MFVTAAQNTRPDVAADYQTLKLSLEAAHEVDRAAYQGRKASFIQQVLAKAGGS